MSTINHTRTQIGNVRSFVANWESMAGNDEGEAIPFSQYADKSVHVVGVLDGATVSIEGSHNGIDWAPMTDLANNTLVFTTPNRIKQVTEVTRFVRPVTSGGGGLTDVTVHFLLKE